MRVGADSQERPEPSGQLPRRKEAEALYRFELMVREMGHSDFVYEEEDDLFRLREDRFAFSRHYIDTKLLLECAHRA